MINSVVFIFLLDNHLNESTLSTQCLDFVAFLHYDVFSLALQFPIGMNQLTRMTHEKAFITNCANNIW